MIKIFPVSNSLTKYYCTEILTFLISVLVNFPSGNFKLISMSSESEQIYLKNYFLTSSKSLKSDRN